MALNPSIILAGRAPDVVGSFSRGMGAAEQQFDFGRKNALAQVYQSQGPGIMAGEQNALNALSRIDPGQAMGVQKDRLGMDATRQGMRINEEQLKLSYENARLRAAELAATMGARERQEAATKIEQGLSGAAFFYQQQDRAGYENFLRQSQLDPAQFPFEAFPAHAAGFKGAADALKGFAPEVPEWQPATQDTAARYGAQSGQINTKTGKFERTPMDQGMTLETGPDGSVRLVQGAGVGGAQGAKFTEGQSKDNVYATRAEGALKALEPVASALTSRGEQLAEGIPLGLGRELQTDNFQLAQQAGQEFLQAILRKDTGAAITEQEQKLYGETYLPQPGDGDAKLEAKRQARARALEAIRAGMNVAQITATERALVAAAERTGTNGPVEIDGFKIEAVE